MGGENYLLLTKGTGKFYYAHDIDAYILNKLLGYKVISKMRCGFPDNAIERVKNKLEENKISYKIEEINKEMVEKDFKLNNNYLKFYKNAFKVEEKHLKLDYLIEKIKYCDNKEIDEIIEAIAECIE